MSLDCPSPITSARTTDLRPALWAAAAAIVSLYLGPAFLKGFQPEPGVYPDFVQEWLSARNFWSGLPVYLPQRDAFRRETGLDASRFDTDLPWNAHPPVAVAVALPFGLFTDYRTAHLAWNLATFPLFVAGIIAILSELGVRWRWWSIFPALALLIANQSLGSQIYQGQLNCLLAALVAVAWSADRRGRPVGAGIAVGAATAIKLFPGFLCIYFLMTRQWRALVAAATTFVLLNLAALGAFGLDDFRVYVEQVVPCVFRHESAWRNVSLTGFWLRVFDPHSHDRIVPLLSSPALAYAAVQASRLLVVLAVAGSAWRARTREERDRAFAAAIAGMLLVTPVAWTHYFLVLAIPVGLLWMRLPAGPARRLMWMACAILWLPEYFFACLAVGPEQALAMIDLAHDPVGPGLNLLALSAFTYSLVLLLVLTLMLPGRGAERPTSDGRPTPEQ